MPESYVIAALTAAGFLLGVVAAGHALLRKRRPQSAVGWIAVCFTLPFLGPLLYFLFGVNRVYRRAHRISTGPPRTPPRTNLECRPPPGLEPLERLGRAVTGLPLVTGNGVGILRNGTQTFQAMLEAIAAARHRVLLSTYIFDAGPLGAQFVDALAAAGRRGADVRVLLDGVGELYSWPRAHRLLRRAGVRFARFLPPRLLPPSFSVNLRNHRKILVVDGTTAFTGGINIRNRYFGPRGDDISDLHFRLDGPVAAQIEAVFVRDWELATDENVALAPVEFTPRGHAACRVVADGPDLELDRLMELLIGAIGAARRRIGIMTPYFVPPRELIGPLQAAALQDVDVAVLLPVDNNLPYVHRATRHMLWELLQRGVKFYYQPPPFAHSKLFFVDDDYAQVGSANLDSRSLRLNFEINVEIYDRPTVAELSGQFEAVRAQSTPITLAAMNGRPLATQILDGACWLASPYL